MERPENIAAHFKDIYNRKKILEFDKVGKVFNSGKGKITALEDINFSVHRREFICVIGASGCGKSTLIRILAGLETATSGQVLLNGEPVEGPGPDRGMVFQSYTLFPWLSVVENVMFGLKENGMHKSAAKTEAMQWLELVGLEGFEYHYPHQLSGGMKQRVAIARAIANQPKLLLMDEPFGALDPQTRSKMQQYLMQLWRHIDLTIVFITHDLDEAIYLADRILVLKPKPGRVDEVIEIPLSRPRTPEHLTSAEFVKTKKYLEKLIHSDDDMNFDLPLEKIRLTKVGDEAE
ncbi:ABC transporter ATP-binding protein [Akkermansiaceae bacterium]|nr:ABC transporter ATP-binding protein [Akkermansiaceae bacterium]